MRARFSKVRTLHEWDLSPSEAVFRQKELARLISNENRPDQVRKAAGVDVHFSEGRARAAVVVLSYPELELLEWALAEMPVTFPYIPGLLGFREGPVVLQALSKINHCPDVIMFDGQGQAHPRRLGLASHIGLWLDHPTIGCAKSRLCGQHQEPGNERGNWAPLIHRGEEIGAVLRTRKGVRPVYVSPGHRMDLAGSISLVLGCCRRYRLPETIRLAHRAAGGRNIELKGRL